MPKESEYTTVSFPIPLLKEIDQIIKNNKELGYSSRAEVFREVIRTWIKEMKEYEKSKNK